MASVYEPPDLSGTDLVFKPDPVAYHGRDELERVYVHGRLALVGDWLAACPEECEYYERSGVWLAGGEILACPGCGLDCT